MSVQVTKFTHSCVRLASGGGRLVVDPGTFSGGAELAAAFDGVDGVDGVDAVLVTHEHPDHLDVEQLSRLLAARPELRVWGPAPVAELLADHRERVTVVGPGESFEAGGLPVRTYGGQHALIHPSIPIVPNIGYLVGDTDGTGGGVLHPGDSFLVPPAPVDTLLLALHAPWSKVGEVLDHVAAVRAPTVHAIHDGLLNDRGRGVVEGHVARVAGEYGSRYAPLGVGEAADT